MGAVSGSCLCGAVTSEVKGLLKPVMARHCHECRTHSGHAFAASDIRRADLVITQERGLAWYRSSPFAQRAFCRTCGAKIFWPRDESQLTHLMMGSVDRANTVQMSAHMGTTQTGDDYAITDRVRQFEGDDL